MDFLFGKKSKKGSGKDQDGQQSKKEDEKIRKQLEKEMKKSKQSNQKAKSDSLKTLTSANNTTSESTTITTGDNIPDNEGGMYNITEIYKVQIPQSKQFDLKIEFLDSNSKNASFIWAIDSMLIDEELLYAEDEEADKIYQELKTRSFRRRNMEEKENRLSISMQQEQDIEEEEEESKVKEPKIN